MMEVLPIQENIWRIGLILGAIIGLYLALSRSPTGKSLWERITLRGRRNSAARTPPRSISPDQKSSPASKATSYNHALPPQRKGLHVDEDEVRSNTLPMTTDYRISSDSLYTPTGFSVQEVKALGDFPDYATLSGIPLPSAYHQFDIDKALPRPYRPFRWAYHQTMSLTKLETDWWIELEKTYKSRITQRKELFTQNGKAVLDTLPGSELACKELMEMVLQFICARYPQYFSLVDNNRVLQNRILGIEQDIRSKPPLEILLDHVPEDFALMMRDDETGYYFLRAAIICSAIGWNVASKIGRQLHEIHEPIPDYKEKLKISMDRFFTKMPTEKPIQRGSWSLEIGEPLYMAPGDPHDAQRQTQNPDLRVEDCFLRVDWQTLRRLPLSASIVFNFKAVFTPVVEFRDEPGVPALISKVLTESKQSFMDYKGVWHVEHVVLPQLQMWAQEQEDTGLVPRGWEVSTLDDSPWYKNWEEKWHRRQGF